MQLSAPKQASEWQGLDTEDGQRILQQIKVGLERFRRPVKPLDDRRLFASAVSGAEASTTFRKPQDSPPGGRDLHDEHVLSARKFSQQQTLHAPTANAGHALRIVGSDRRQGIHVNWHPKMIVGAAIRCKL